MSPLYRNLRVLPSLFLSAITLGGCDQPPVPKAKAEPVPNAYLEALQQAEAVKHDIEEGDRQQRELDVLLGRGQTAPR